MLEQKKKRGPKGKITKEMAEEMLRLNQQGYTMESIGKQFNCTQPNVSRCIQRLKAGGYNA